MKKFVFWGGILSLAFMCLLLRRLPPWELRRRWEYGGRIHPVISVTRGNR